MTDNDIIRMAREAGFFPELNWDHTKWSAAGKWLAAGQNDTFEKLVELARAEEREACAQICEQFADQDSGPDGIVTDYHAHLIRARGNK